MIRLSNHPNLDTMEERFKYKSDYQRPREIHHYDKHKSPRTKGYYFMKTVARAWHDMPRREVSEKRFDQGD